MKKFFSAALALIALFFVFPAGTSATAAPTVEGHLMAPGAKVATLKIRTEKGAKVTVVGGPSDLAPITDGEGKDVRDGYVEIMVGVVPQEKNIFSVTAQVSTGISNSIVYTIDLTPPPKAANSTSSPDSSKKSLNKSGEGLLGDRTPPSPPVIDSYPSVYEGNTIELAGSVETLANIYVRNPDGKVVGSTQANELGLFKVKADLEVGKTNRLNVSAEDPAGNEGPSNQVVIRVPAPEEKKASLSPEKVIEYVMPFQDIKNHWAKSYINDLQLKRIVSGKTDDSFDPDGRMTRAEFTKIAMNAFGYKIDLQDTATDFQDVGRNDWFAPYIKAAYDQKIVEGEGKHFYPNQPVTRAAALKILLKAGNFALTSTVGVDFAVMLKDFKDVDPKAWYAPYLIFAKSNGIAGGYADGTFRPNATLTRAEAAKITSQVLKLKQ